jgi:hypothetical protein
MMHFRHVLGLAAAGVTVSGLMIPTQAAVAAAGPCANGNDVGTTHSLTADCELSSTWTVEAGWAIDGNGHTITLAPGFTGPAIRSASGASGVAAPSMSVAHVTIDAAGASAGIVFDGATGGVHDVRITGASGTDYGVEVDNTVGAVFGATGQVKIDKGTTISGYQRAGVYVHGDAKLNVLRAVIGSPRVVPGQGVAGILATDGAHGSIKENTIRLSDTEPASPSAYGAGVRIVGDALANRRMEVKRNVFSGTDADFGITVENPAQAFKMTAATDCNLFRRNDSSATDPYGVAVAAWDGPKSNLLLSNSTFVGWKHASGNVSGTSVSAGPANPVRTSDSTCKPAAPAHVVAAGGDRRSKVTWHAAAAPAWAPLTGYLVQAKAKGHPAISKTVGPTARSTVLTRLNNSRTYTVTVTARSNGGQAHGTDVLYPTKITLKAKPGTIHRGAKSSLRGTLSSADRKAHLGKRKVAIWAKPKGGKWSKIATVKTRSTGRFATTVKPHKRTVYKAVYAGHPDLASSGRTTVVVKR